MAVAGGDGTLGVAARALCNTETALAPFPAGTMKDVYKRQVSIHAPVRVRLINSFGMCLNGIFSMEQAIRAWAARGERKEKRAAPHRCV